MIVGYKEYRAFINDTVGTKGMLGIFEFEWQGKEWYADCIKTLYTDKYNGTNLYVSHMVPEPAAEVYMKIKHVPKNYNDFFKEYPEYTL